MNAQAQQFQINVDGEFSEETLQFTGGVAPPYSFMWDMRVVNGSLAICGVGHLRDSRFRDTIRQILRGGVVTVNGQEYPVDLNFFSRARTRNAMSGTPATCQSVVAFNGGQASFRLGAGTFRN